MPGPGRDRPGRNEWRVGEPGYLRFLMLQLLSQKRELAWTVTRKWAVAELYGPEHAPLVAPLAPEDFQSYLLRLVSAAIARGRFFHGLDADDALEAIIRARGWGQDVPYADDFAAAFARRVAAHDAVHVVEALLLECAGYADDYPAFFLPDAGGYQYLRDVLAEARHAGGAPDTPALARALEWLGERAAAAPSPYHGLAALTSRPVPPPASAEEMHWAAVLIGPAARPDVERLLEAVALLARDAAGRCVPAPESAPGGWVGAMAALQAHRWLGRNAAALARALHASYGPVVSLRALQAGFKENNAAHAAAHRRADAWARQHPPGAAA